MTMIALGKQIAQGAGWTIAMRLGERLIGLVSTLLLARLLVPADFGLIAMGTSIAAVLEAITAFGFEWAIIQRQASDRKHLDTAWTLGILVGFFNAVVLCALIPVAVSFYKEPRVTGIILTLGACSALGGFRNIGLVMYEQALRFERIFALSIGRKIVSFLVTLSVAFYMRSYWALVAGMFTSAIVDLALSYLLHPYRPRLSLVMWRDLFGFSKWLLINNVLFFASARGSDFVIGNRQGPAALGTYSVAYEIANLPTSELVAPIMRAVYPGYAKMAADRVRLAQGFQVVFGLVVVFCLPAAAGIACLAHEIVAVMLGPKWIETSSLIVVLAVLGATRALQANTGSVYLALNQPYVLTMLTALYIAIGLPSFTVVLMHTDLISAAWALVVSQAVVGTLNFAVLLPKLNIQLKTLLLLVVRPLTATALMVGVVLFAKNLLWSEGAWPLQLGSLLLLMLLGAAAYGAALFALWVWAGRPEGAESRVEAFLQGIFGVLVREANRRR